MSDSGWQKFVRYINSKEIGHIFKRSELLLWAKLNELSSSTIDVHRNMLVQTKFFTRIKSGTYELTNKLPEGTTTTEVYMLLKGDRLKYLEKIVTRKERTKRQDEQRRIAQANEATNRRIITEAISRPCLDCKGSFPTEVMQFSYRQTPRWDRELSKMILGNTQRLVDEVGKCDVICMNSHLIRHSEKILA
jgi:hypothetical protein